MSKRKWIKIIAFLLVIISIMIISGLTSNTGEQSHRASRWVAKSIENLCARYFEINRKDLFWRETLNNILRKVAHFFEFAFLGVSTALFFLVLMKRKWLSMLASILICVGFAVLDEYRQMSIPGRNPQWFDVKLDIAGALAGIAVISMCYWVYSIIRKLKSRIRQLESTSGNH